MATSWATAFRAAVSLYKYRQEIQHWWKKLEAYVDYGNTNIVVLGRSAVGKSVLVSQLYPEASNYSQALREISTSVEVRAIQLGDWTNLVRVIPGQENTEHYKGLKEAFDKHYDLEGVIFVVDWGYTVERNAHFVESMIQEKKIDSIEKLRAYNLEQELENFKKVCEKIKASFSNGTNIKWLLIAVNKVDLFLESIDDAQKYYSTEFKSPFGEILNNMLMEVGKQNLKCAVMPISSWQKDFAWNGETIKTNLGETDKKHELFQNFIEKIAKLSN